VSAEFDRYWNSRAVVAVSAMLPPANAEEKAALADAMARVAADPAAARYRAAEREARVGERLARGELASYRGRATVLADDPEKALQAKPGDDVLLLPKLVQALGPFREELVVVSAYFVPGEPGARELGRIRAGGARVRVLTNSLAATDVVAAHAGYARYRKALLGSGVELNELEAGAGSRTAGPDTGLGGSSRAALHAKTLVADRSRIFVGSFNFDPRSARLNTEMGIVFDNAEAAAALAAGIDRLIGERAYAVLLARESPSGLQWLQPRPALTYDEDPQAGALKRFNAWFLSLLPIEDQL
jgi:putative cardiolipin synthase